MGRDKKFGHYRRGATAGDPSNIMDIVPRAERVTKEIYDPAVEAVRNALSGNTDLTAAADQLGIGRGDLMEKAREYNLLYLVKRENS